MRRLRACPAAGFSCLLVPGMRSTLPPRAGPRPPGRPTRVLLAVVGVLAVAAIGRAAEPAPASAEAWQTLSLGDDTQAARQFAGIGASREAALGAALAAINRPPVTPTSLEDARRQLTELARTSDDPGHAAQYFLGRLLQLHPFAPDPAAAVRAYEALVATGADDRWCRLALIKLVLLRLTLVPGPGDLAARQAAVEGALTRTGDAGTRRDLHLVIAEARLGDERYDAVTLGHLRAALAATAPADILRPDLLIQTGRLASRLGERAVAHASYAAFLRDYPKERRTFTVSSALEHLDGPFPP